MCTTAELHLFVFQRGKKYSDIFFSQVEVSILHEILVTRKRQEFKMYLSKCMSVLASKRTVSKLQIYKLITSRIASRDVQKKIVIRDYRDS